MGFEGFNFNRRFYVYVIFHPITGHPCYIGKGTNRRDRRQAREPKNRRLRSLANKYGDLPVVRIRDCLTEAEAFVIERALIGALGRTKDNGCLYNVTKGGDGVEGMRHTPESKAKIAASHRGRKWPEWFSQRVKAGIAARVDKPSPLKGRKQTPEHIENKRRSATGIKRSPEAREKMRLAHLGKKLTPSHRQAIIEGKTRATAARLTAP